MSTVESAQFAIGDLDLLARGDTPIHRRDPRAKVIVALAFIVTVVSYNKYDISGLIPLFIYPVALAAIGDLPPGALLGRLLLASPFALIVGVFNPFLDRTIALEVGPITVTGGWVSYASILLRFLLTVSAALVLISTTGFTQVCMAMNRLGVPKILTVQLLLLYRYIFVLAGEASRMHKAWSLRSVGEKRIPMRILGSLAGQLLLRALDRAQRLHMAMLSRGFDGEIRLTRTLFFGLPDIFFILGWQAFFVLVRCYNLPRILGQCMGGTT